MQRAKKSNYLTLQTSNSNRIEKQDKQESIRELINPLNMPEEQHCASTVTYALHVQ